ncbi:MAG TPA: hypothetical protein VLZ75_12910 [Chitinophagales bacterium]|nr:hypothetical protein [Chitinophagales bacterium]
MTSRQYLLRLKSVFFSILLTALLIGAISYFMLQPSNGLANGQSLYFMMGFGIAIFCLLLYILLNKQKNQEAAEFPKLSDKLIAFQNNYLTSISLLLAPTLVNFILYGIGGPMFNFYIGLFLTGLLAGRFPTITLLSKSLELKEKDIKNLQEDQFKLI